MDDYRVAATDELKRLEEDIFYTEKVHFAAAEELQRVHLILGVTATVAATATSVSVITDGPTWIAGSLALLAAVFSGLLTFVKPDERATQHLTSARILGDIRLQARQHRELDLHSSTPEQPEVWRGYVEAVRVAKRDSDASAPPLNERALDKAKKKIDRGDFDHAVDL